MQQRLARLDFPKFSGNETKHWLIQCETFFSVDQTPDDHKVRLAVMHLEGKAMHWHSAYVRAVRMNNLPSWEEYAQLLIDRFGEVYDDPMAELMNIRQKGLVEQYHEVFDTLVSRVDLSTEQQLSCFLGGLHRDIQMVVRMFQPATVRKAYSLAKMYENSSSSPLQFSNARGVKPVSTPVLSETHKQPVLASKPHGDKKLSQSFIAERRAK